MLKRRFLIRFTRLSMAMYGLFFCMSMTVSASDNPISDLAVSGSSEIVSENGGGETPVSEPVVGEDGGSGEQGDPVSYDENNLNNSTYEQNMTIQNDTIGGNASIDVPDEGDDPVIVPVPENNNSTESGNLTIINGTEIENDTIDIINETEPMVKAAPLTGITVDFSNLTITDISKTYENPVNPVPADADFNRSNITVGVNGDQGVMNYNGIGILYENANDSLVIDPRWARRSSRFNATVFYNHEGNIITTQCDVLVHIHVYDLGLRINDGLVNRTGEEPINLTNQTPKNISIKVKPEYPESVELDESKITWQLLENEEEIDGSGIFTTQGENATLDLTNYEGNAHFRVIATYNNSYVDYSGNEQFEQNATTYVDINLNNVEEPEVTDIAFNSTGLTITDFTQPYYLNLSAVDEGVTLSEGNISYDVRFETSYYTNWNDVKITRTGTEFAIDVSNLTETKLINLTAIYNARGTNITKVCPILAQVVPQDITIAVEKNGYPVDANGELNITGIEMTGGDKVTFRAVSENPAGLNLNDSHVTLFLERDGKTVAFNSTAVGCENWKSDNWFVLHMTEAIGRTQYVIGAIYNTSYIDVDGNHITGTTLSTNITVNVDIPTPDYVSAIKLDKTALTITDFAKEYALNTLKKSGKGVINASRVEYSILDENRTPSSELESLILRPVTDSSICILDVSGLTESTKFYVVSKYTNSSGSEFNATCTVVAQVVASEVYFEAYTSTEDVIPSGTALNVSSGTAFNITSNNGYVELDLYSKNPSGKDLDTSKIKWTITENGKAVNVTKRGLRFEASEEACYISVNDDSPSNFTFNKTGTFNITAVYSNDYKDAAGKAVKPKAASASCVVNIDTRSIEEKVEAHFPETTATVQIYNVTNTIPFNVRFKDTDQGYLLYEVAVNDTNPIRLKPAAESQPSYIDYIFNVTLNPNSRSINVNLYDSVLEGNNSMLTDLIKRKTVKCNLSVPVSLFDGNNNITTYVDSAETITITIGTAKPTVKVNGITFDSYRELEQYDVTFTGATVTHFEFQNETTAAKSGLYNGSVDNTILTATGLPKKSGKKTVKLVAYIEDSNYKLPSGYNVTVPLTYNVVDGAPVLKLNSTSCTLNKLSDDYMLIPFNLTGDLRNTNVSFALLDSKNKNLSENNITVWVNHTTGSGNGYVVIRSNVHSVPGQTYKVNLYPFNTENDVTGAVKTITVKLIDARNSNKTGLTLKTKGSIDASVYGTNLTLTITGKNINLYGKSSVVSVMSGDTNISHLFKISQAASNTYVISEKEAFNLLNAGLGGQKVNVTVNYGELVAGQPLNTTLSVKIGKSTVTPKLGVTSVSYNPEMNYKNISIPITNMKPGIYNYRVNISIGKETAPFSYAVTNTSERDEIIVIPDESGLSYFVGKTATVSIVPIIPEGFAANITLPARAATCKITILNPTKAKASVSAKVKGNIDSVRDITNSTATLSFKNLYDPSSVLLNTSCYVIVQNKTQNISYTLCFDITRNGNDIILKRRDGYSLNAGTYKLVIYATIQTGNSPDINTTLNTTTSFKVVRGTGTKSAIVQKKLKLTNLEYDSSVIYNVTVGDTRVNNIARICLGGNGKFNQTFNITRYNATTGGFVLQLFYGYVEKASGKPIKKAVTKTVPIEVYYKGSPVPDKLNLQVIINP